MKYFSAKVTIKVMITDEDATTESKVKANVNPEIEKWSDINHKPRCSHIEKSLT